MAKMALKKALIFLAAIVAATFNEEVEADKRFAFVDKDAADALKAAGFVEVNYDLKNEKGEVATRATEAGQKQAVTPATGAEAPKPSFQIVTSVPVPDAKKRGGRGGNLYPFDELPVNGSFFVPATTDRPDPWKSLASTVSSATERFAVEVKDDAGNAVMEDHKVTQYQLDADGKRAKGLDGKLIKIGETIEKRPKMKKTREFTIREVADGAPWGFTGQKGAGIWRTA